MTLFYTIPAPIATNILKNKNVIASRKATRQSQAQP